MPTTNGWIKLHRKVLDNGILRDQTAWVIFSWLMLKVDRKTGKKIIGRFWVSEELGIKPSTFYKALKRLEKKYKVVTLSSNNKSTDISLTNWHKYQSGNSAGNNKVTTKEQQSNTLQEVENREVKNSINGIVKKQPVCPVLKSPLKEKYPKGHEECVEYLLAIEENRKIKFSNRAKQFMFLHKLLRVNCDFEAMDSIIADIEKKYGKNNWDFSTVSNWLDKGGGNYG